jgi:GNAT superfamily N-acetyltransferase
MPQIAQTDEDIARCFDTIAELRPHVKREDLVALVRDMQSGGYRLAFVEQSGRMGRHLYVEDLVTADKVRSKGLGRQMIRWLRDQARAAGCAYLDLDSGTQRSGAHRFYFRHGLTIASYHFSEKLDDH